VVVALWCCTAVERSWKIINVSIVKNKQNVPCLEPSFAAAGALADAEAGAVGAVARRRCGG
jgi:hypothetical protein